MISSEKLHTMNKEFYAMLENKTDITEKSYFLYNLSHCPTQQPQILTQSGRTALNCGKMTLYKTPYRRF